MGIFSEILGTDGVVDGIKDGIDKSILTDEERLDYHKQMLKAYEPFKLIQRYLALLIVGSFVGVLFIQVLIILLDLHFVGIYGAVKEINDLESTQMLGYAFISVIALYFSGGVVNSFKGKK